MSELVVVGFEDTQQADRALTELVRLTKEHLIDLEDAVVATVGEEEGGPLGLLCVEGRDVGLEREEGGEGVDGGEGEW